VSLAQRRLGVSERRACRVLEQPRTTQRYCPDPDKEEERLSRRLLELVRSHPRYGYRRMTALLQREGWRINRKRVHRLWRRQGLRVPAKVRKRRRLGHSGNSCVRRRPQYQDHVWTWDFLFDRTRNGRSLKWFSLVDEYTRECLALEVHRRMTSQEIIEVLTEVLLLRGAPENIRSDNGPEFIAQAIRRWLERTDVKSLYIEPGAPWENGYAESFNSRLRDELLNVEVFETVAEAQTLAAAWRAEYNHRRPHSSLGYQTPAEFATKCARAVSPAPLRSTGLTARPSPGEIRCNQYSHNPWY
jgi:putative transposase